MRIQISVAAMLLSLSAVSQAAMFEPVPEPTIAPQDQAKVELGKMLWFDPRLSKSGFISCNSCHNLSTGGVDNLKTSVGHGWQQCGETSVLGRKSRKLRGAGRRADCQS